jgi:hypothetical protein
VEHKDVGFAFRSIGTSVRVFAGGEILKVYVVVNIINIYNN